MSEKTKSPTRNKKQAIVSIILIAAILITGAFAFLTATDSKTNVFTVGNVDIEFHEIFNNVDYGKNEDPGAQGIKINNIVPGQSIQKAPYIVNSGNNPAYVYFAVGIPTDTSDNVYNGNNTYTAKTELNIKVNAYAIQEQYNGATNADDTWTNYFKKSMISGAESDAGIELFTLNDGTSTVTTGTHTISSDWQEFSTPYSVTDSGNSYTYHFYKYKANDGLLSVGSSTSHLFENVVFNENVGEGRKNESNSGFIQPEELNWATLSASETSDVVVLSAVEDSNGDTTEIFFYTDGSYTLDEIKAQPLGDDGDGNQMTIGEMLAGADGMPITIKSFSEAGQYKLSDILFEMSGDYAFEYYQMKDGSEISGWRIYPKDLSKTEYSEIPTSKLGVPVISIDFSNCTNMVTAPEIPNSILSLQSAFENCTSLTVAPVIPNSVKDVSYCFYNCSSLSGAVEVNASLGEPTSSCNYFAHGTQITEITGTTQYKAELLATRG